MEKSFEISLPGFTKDQVEVTVQPYQSTHLLDIKAKSPSRTNVETYILPAKCDPSTLQAKLDLGILTITCTVKESAMPRKIVVV